LIGAPQPFARKRLGWHAHPTAAGVKVHAWQGLWHSGVPGRQRRIVVVRRPTTKRSKKASQRKPPPRVEAFFTTDLSVPPEDILNQ
jgi:hypothetical protein